MQKILKIDLDIKMPYHWQKDWEYTRKEILKSLGHEAEDFQFFPTKRGWHVYIKLTDAVDDDIANKLQFLCGDDHTRVKINEWRIKKGIKRWNKLFHRVLYRKKAKVIECWFCGNKIPVRD